MPYATNLEELALPHVDDIVRVSARLLKDLGVGLFGRMECQVAFGFGSCIHD